MNVPPISEVAICFVRAWVYTYTRGLPDALRETRRAEIDSDLWEHQQAAILAGRHPAAIAGEISGRWLMGLPADLTWRWEQRNANGEPVPEGAGERRRMMQSIVRPEPFETKWAIAVPVLLIGLSVVLGFQNMAPGENMLRDLIGSRLGAAIVAGFFPALMLAAGVVWAWRAPAIRVAMLMGLLYLYWAAALTWMTVRGGWYNLEALPALAGLAGSLLFLTGLSISRSRPRVGGPLALVGAIGMAGVLFWSLITPVLALLLGVYGLRRAQRIAVEQQALA